MAATPPTSDAPDGPAPAEPGAPSGATAGATPPPPQGPRVTGEQMRDLGRMRRSASDRKLAGVAGGIARHFDVDPLVVRIALVVLVFFGGGGLLIYGAVWLFVPEEGSDRAVLSVDERSRSVLLIMAGVVAALSMVGDTLGGWGFPWPLAIAGLVVAAILVGRNGLPRPHPGPVIVPPLTGGPPPGSGGPHAAGPTYAGYRPQPPPAAVPPRRRGPILFGFTLALLAVVLGVVATVDLAGVDVPVSAYPATVLATCGLMLVVGAFYGRGGGLIAVGLLAALATLATTAVDQLDTGVIDTRPTSAAALADDYDLWAGEIQIDLTEVEDLDGLDDRVLALEAVFGRIEVLVPERGLDVTADATVEGGDVTLFGDHSTSSSSGTHDGGSGVPELTIDAEVVFGEIDIETVGSTR